MAGVCVMTNAQTPTEVEHKEVTIDFSKLGAPTLTDDDPNSTSDPLYYKYKLEDGVYLEIKPLDGESVLTPAEAGDEYGNNYSAGRTCLIFPRASDSWWAANKPQYFVRVVADENAPKGVSVALHSFKITGSTLPQDFSGVGGATVVFGDIQEIESGKGDPQRWWLITTSLSPNTAGYESANTFYGIYFNVNTQPIEVNKIDVCYALIPNSEVTTNYITTISDVDPDNLVDLSTTYYVKPNDNNECWLTIDRDFKPGWNTVCLPITINAKELLGEGARVNEFVSYDPAKNMVTFSEVEEGTMIENTPYLIWNPSDETVSDAKVLKEMVHAGALHAVRSGNFSFEGNYKAGMSMEGLYGVVNTSKTQSKILKGAAESTLNGLRAYFTYEGEQSQKLSAINVTLGDGTVSSLETILEGTDAPNAPVYDIQGRRVNQTVRGQLYIRAGKKFIAE